MVECCVRAVGMLVGLCCFGPQESLPRCMSRPSSAELFPSGRFPQVAVGVLALGRTAGRMRSGGSFVVVECG